MTTHLNFKSFMTAFNKIKSKNWQVQDLDTYIRQHQGEDSDYWHGGGGGNDDIIHQLLHFDNTAWKALKENLPGWAPEQTFILANALRQGDDHHWASQILSQRAYLFSFIVSLADDNILTDLLDDFDFIKEGTAKPSYLLVALRKRLEALKGSPIWEAYRPYREAQLDKLIGWLDQEILTAMQVT